MSLNFIVTQINEVELAKMMHEAAREAVTKGLVVRRDVPNNGFIEWDQLDDAAREGRLIQARFLLAQYSIADPDDVTELDESLDCARRDFTAATQEITTLTALVRQGRSAAHRFIEMATEKALPGKEELEQVATQIGNEAGTQEDKDAAIALLRFIIDSSVVMPPTAAICPDPVEQYHRAKEGLTPCPCGNEQFSMDVDDMGSCIGKCPGKEGAH